MGLYSGATFKPTSWGGKTPRNRQGRGILHVAVSTRVSYPPFNGNTWHFYIAAAALDGSTDGSGGPAYCEQYVDTDYRAYGDVDANDDAIVMETAGAANPATVNTERWTRATELRIADIMRWEATQPGGAPLQLLPDAKAGRTGWGPHRLGIKHSAGLVPGWWFPGCEVWSTKLGKECPGDAKIAQIPGIIEMARSGAPMEDDMYGVLEKAFVEARLPQIVEQNASIINLLLTQRTEMSALKGLVTQLAGNQGTPIDMAAVEAVVEKGVKDAIEAIETTVVVHSDNA